MVARTVGKLIAPIARRVRLLARRAVVKLVYDDPLMQELQLSVFDSEVRDRVERWQDYGFTSHPLPGAEAIILALGGNTDHGAAIKVDDRRYRVRALAAGEVAIHDNQGQVIHLKENRTVHIYGCDTLVADVAVQTNITCPLITATASTKITLNTPLLECSGDISSAGNITAQGDITAGGDVHADGEVSDGIRAMSADRTIYNGHTHPGDSGGTTGETNQEM